MSPFRYPGGKSRVARLMKSFFPGTFSEYREPFVGGGGVYWTMPVTMSRWVNDLNRPLIAVYEALKRRPRDFYESCVAIAPPSAEELARSACGGQRRAPRLFELFEQFKADDEMDQALRYLFLNRCSWNGRVILDPARYSRTAFTKPQGWSDMFLRDLARAADLVAGTTVTCSDFETLFDEPGSDVLIFADPPYVKDTELSLNAKLYERGFSMADHRRLRDCAARCKHKIVLTYDDHPMIRALYREGFYVHPQSWRYLGRADRKMGHELVITNYPVMASSNAAYCVQSAA